MLEGFRLGLPLSMTKKAAVSLHGSELLLDTRNVELLELLSADPRTSTSELARRIGMSAPAVRERVQRLQESGVIKGYRLDIDSRALELPRHRLCTCASDARSVAKGECSRAAPPRGHRVLSRDG